jgi:hypothetical protein
MEIFKPTQEFEFNKITLGNPLPIQGGAFFSKVIFSDNEKELFIQLPKCTSKQAIITTKRGKYCDLMYARDENEPFFNWLEKLETVFHGLIDKNKNLWFTGDYSKDDIENMMSPITRMYKSGAYILIRVYINSNKHTGEDKCSVYNEDEVNIDINTIVPETNIIPLVLIDGVKFTSRSFELDIKLSQIMVLKEPVNTFKKCLIRMSDAVENNQINTPALDVKIVEAAKAVEAVKEIKEIKEVTLSIQSESEDDVVSDEDKESDTTISVPAVPVSAPHVPVSAPHVPVSAPHVPVSAPHVPVSAPHVPVPAVPAVPAVPVVPALPAPSGPIAVKKYNTNLEEVNLENIIDDNLERIKLKKPNEVYYDIYRSAREKAKNMRKLAIQAYLEAKEIKTKYILEDIDISDDDEETEYKL